MSRHETHNRLASEFVQRVASQAESVETMMVIMESTILAAMLVLHKKHGMKKQKAAEMIEYSINRAVERFSASN
jgi:hypothetical protein